MSTPRSDIDIDLLQALGITTVLTLTKEEPLPGHWFEFKSIKNVHIPIENYQAPTLAEMDYIYNQYTSDRTSVWLVHCGGGKGRAGTVLACLIAMHDQTGSEPTPYPNLDTTSAISTIRSLRPGSIESNVQETFVGQYIQHRWRIAQSDPPPDESSESMSIDSALPSSFAFHKDVTHLLLVGLPGAGKSWLSIAIAKRRKARGLKTLIINQDTTRSRSACEEAFGRDHAPALVILDRCNPSASDRAYFLSLLPTKHTIVAVHLSSSLPICEARIASRLDHPTIPIGRGTNALTSMSHDLDLPTLKESFCALITVPSFPAAHSAALLLGGEIALTKFPRTPHLLDLGAATSDDLISPVPSLPTRSPLISPAPQSIGKTIIEEKLDGANLGISLSPSGSLVTQNRSHYVSATDHAQFRPLPTWLARHDSALKQLLGRDPHLSDRWTLYGEWLVAKHSIHYSSLPDLFLAFDLYDRVEGTYVSRRLLERALKGTGIGMVPLIETREGGVGEEELRGMVQGRSRYYEGRVEGVYVRFEDAEGRRTVRRGKVVRGDFLAGDEHWSRRGVVKSGVLREGASRDDGDVGVA
ncbi:Hypothetical protein D9617_94g089190 [Elsinoe fawcettii]|nr:Hypothetical protein D9617_94g089190 [Elsinoe fawcettii]